MDDVGSQYSLLLTQQLESQRKYFEGIIKENELNFEIKLKNLKSIENQSNEIKKLENKIENYIDKIKKKDDEIKKKDDDIKFFKNVFIFFKIFIGKKK
jgi:coproporphyrinogen III oxidase-like Fe-S oxidoreductase